MIKQHVKQFRKIFFSTRVFAFILLGTVIIFLTFLTNDNAMEIAISGVASVFIGIGVNNFSSVEASLREQQKQKSKRQHLLSILELVELKAKRIQSAALTTDSTAIKADAAELEKLAALTINLLKENPKDNS
ncbi:MAG: hypothetical protein QM791_11685 [Ferruginibacter sp.]